MPRVCPHCNGSGTLEADPRDTIKMSQDEFTQIIHNAVRTPPPPPYEVPPLVFEEERVTLASDTWMTKRVTNLRRSYLQIMTMIVLTLGLAMFAFGVLMIRGC